MSSRMNAATLLAQLTATREADQRHRLADLLTRATQAARWCALITAACAFPVLALVVAWGSR